MTEITIRPATAGDHDFVLSAARELARFDPPEWRRREEIVAGEVRTLRAFLAVPDQASALFVAEGPAGDPVGFLFMETVRDYFSGELLGHVSMIAVTPKAEGAGVGGALMRAGEEWAANRGFQRVSLNVFETNRRARAVYEHLGYRPETMRYVKILHPSGEGSVAQDDTVDASG